jgi:hypothetical protein
MQPSSVGGGFILTKEKNFRRIMGWKDLWQLETILGRKISDQDAAQQVAA